MTGIHDGVVWKTKKLAADGIEQLLCRATLQVGPAVTTDEQRITCEYGARYSVAGAAIGMSRRGKPVDACFADRQRFSLEEKPIGTIDHTFCSATIDDLCAGASFQERCTGNVVRMNVRFDGEKECQAKISNDLTVSFDVFQDGINDYGPARSTVRYDVGTCFGSIIDILCIVHVQ